LDPDVYNLCPHWRRDIESYSALHFNPEYVRFTHKIMRDTLNIHNGQFIAVHHRNLEGHCERYSRRWASPKLQALVTRYGCGNWTVRNVREVAVSVLGETTAATLPIFVASDGQNKELLREFERAGAVSLRTPEIEKAMRKHSPPILDMVIMSKARLFLGNPLSTFSLTVANLRMAEAMKNQAADECLNDINVLLWPERALTMQKYWKCPKAKFFCGPDKFMTC